jgi:hypothetical protein
MATFYRRDEFVKAVTGQAVPGADIYVCDQPANIPAALSAATPTPTPLSSIFSDNGGLVPVVQPVETDGFGHGVFYVAPGIYTVAVYLNSILQQQYADQAIGTAGTLTA